VARKSDIADELEVYLVGGAVRDGLLGRAVGDKDWVVLHSSVARMRKLGFTQVGRDFPVFLHPDTHEEYALARTERKQGQGHRGFVVDASPEVTLEEDLQRRDLTINAIARDPQGDLIDPFGGAADLQARIFRHVSPAFAEDPLRVFRVARFATQLPEFTVAPETLHLMQQMCQAGELSSLSAERVWQETEKALSAAAPERFFDVLEQVAGLDFWMPELRGQSPQFKRVEAVYRYAELPLNEAEFDALARRLKVPGRYQQMAADRLQWAEIVMHFQSIDVDLLARALQALQVNHDNTRLLKLLEWLQLDHEQKDSLQQLGEGWRAVRISDAGLSGKAYGNALYKARCEWLDQVRR
jgi:tRNA nucleotidyltransferase/poly(A) polymerase